MKTFTVKVENTNITLTTRDTFKDLQAKLNENGIEFNMTSTVIKGLPVTEDSIVANCLSIDDGTTDEDAVEFVLPDLPEMETVVGEGESANNDSLCRLCGIQMEKPIYIFGKSEDVAERINKLIPVSVSETDGMSKNICISCHKKINFIHDFVLICVQTEKKLADLDKSMNSSLTKLDTETGNSSQKHQSERTYRCPNCKISLMILKDGQPQNSESAFEISLTQISSCEDSDSVVEATNEKVEDIPEPISTRRVMTRSKRNSRKSFDSVVDNERASCMRTRRQTQSGALSQNNFHIENTETNVPTKRSSREKGKVNLRDIRKRASGGDNSNGKLADSVKRRKLESDALENALMSMNSDLEGAGITGEFIELDTLEDNSNDSIKQQIILSCPICDLKFYSQGKYSFHMDRHESGNVEDFICIICKKEFPTENALWEHHSSSHGEYACTSCGQTFAKESKLKHHLQKHGHDSSETATNADLTQTETSKKSTKSTCEECGARFVLRERYEFHMERHRFGKIKTFSCLICDKRFKSENILWDHHQYQHRAGERFACLTCDKTFVKRANLNYHLKTFGHKGAKVVNGLDQNQRSDSSSGVKLSDVGKPRPKITCSECGARFVLQERYEFHMERHKSGNMDTCVCTLCGRESTNENVLWDHYQYMHKRTKRYACTTCGKLFHKQSMLSRHQVKYGHRGTREIDIETENNATNVDSAAFKKVIAEEVVEMKSVNCVLCGEVVWGVDPNLINDAVTCTSCEGPGLSLQVDSDGAKVISRRQYHCNMCNKHFTTKDRLEYHIMRHSENMDEFICSTCGKELSTEQALFEHYLFVHKGARPHVCELCGKSYQFKARLKEHMRSHSGERPFACEICGQRCMTNNALRSHKKTHITEKRFPCQICKKAFRKRQDLNEHLERHWKNDKTMMLPQVFSCTICLEMFPTFRILKKHLKEDHRVESQDPILAEQQPLFECEDCHEKFKHQMSLKVHRERVHEGKMRPVYHCDVCDVTYKNARVLSNHIKNKHEGGKRYKCAQCGKEYNQSTSLHNHILLHTGEKPFSCEHCEMTFRTKESRDHHQRKHTGERPYKCPHCEKTFATTTQRREHRKREHDEGNDHHCPECGKVCFDEHGVRSHLNTHMVEKLKPTEDIST